MHRHWVQFTLMHKRYDNHNCHNKPQIGNVAGVRMTSCPEATVLRIWRFWKRVRLELTGGQAGENLGLPLWHWELSSLCHGVESWKVDWKPCVLCHLGRQEKWGPTMMLRNWVKTMIWRIWVKTTMFRSWGPTRQLGVSFAKYDTKDF